MSESSCLICKESYTIVSNYLLTCYDCRRSWHHRCRMPPISDAELNALFSSFLASGVKTNILLWRCTKCARKQAAISPPTFSTSVLEVDLLDQYAPPRTVSEIIDLTESPQAHRSHRVQVSQVQEAQVTGLSEFPLRTISTPLRSAEPSEVIDLSSDSPHSVGLEFPEACAIVPTNSPDATILPHMDVDLDEIPASNSPTLRENPDLPDAPIRAQAPDIKFHLMEVDDIDQKPRNLAVTDSSGPHPRGGSLGPAWIRENGYMLMLERYIKKQKKMKPLSKRKLENPQFISNSGERFLVLPTPKEY
ncbi:hypothetical protein B0H11DRAFT_1169068 [Mycena galericulata]|nr:hypothetical protein B0H11DRAFT_1169068 [Mycena galericulata]